MLGLTIRMKKKWEVSPQLWDMQPLLCNKYTLLQRSSVYAVVRVGWLTDWLTEKQADRQLYFGAYFSKNNGQLSAEGWGDGTLILSYICRFGPLLEVQNFEFHFFFWGGGGVRKINNMFWGMMLLWIIFWTFCGVISIQFRVFLKVKVQYWKKCLGLLNFKKKLGMPDIPYIFGGKE